MAYTSTVSKAEPEKLPTNWLPVAFAPEYIIEEVGNTSCVQYASLPDALNVTAKLYSLSKLLTLKYWILEEGNVPAPGFSPLALIRLIDVVWGQVTIFYLHWLHYQSLRQFH